MPHPTPRELKRILAQRGFEIFRTTADEVVLADRVRENLLMDSGVAARSGDGLSVRLTVRAEAAAFPGEGEPELIARARRLAATLDGYSEVETRTVRIPDPGEPARTLDTWYELCLVRPVADLDELESALRAALALERVAG